MLPTRYGHTEFYSVAAQIIPVLLLAIVFEQRLFRRKDIPTLVTSVVSSLALGGFFVAEAVSLRVLFRGYAHRQDQILVIAPLIVATLLLLLPIVLTPLIKLEREGKPVQTRIAQAVTCGTGGFVLLIFLVLLHQ